MKNKLQHFLLLYLVCTFLVLCCMSCKSNHKVIVQPLKEQGPEYLFEQMKKNELKFKTISIKFSAEAEIDNNNTEFSGNLYMVRDSSIWLSVSKFGLEVARFLITQDSAKMLNRFNSTYFIGDFNYVSEMFKVDFDFDILQSLIIGNDFSYYDNNVFKASIDNKNYKLSTIGRRKLKKYVRKDNEMQRVLIQDIWLDPVTFKIVKISMKEVKQENRKFESNYSKFETLDDQRYASDVTFDITDDKKRIKVDVNFSKIVLDKEEIMPFKIPSGYTKIEK